MKYLQDAPLDRLANIRLGRKLFLGTDTSLFCFISDKGNSFMTLNIGLNLITLSLVINAPENKLECFPLSRFLGGQHI